MRLLSFGLALAGAGTLLLAAGSRIESASARGTVSFGHDDRGLVLLKIEQGGDTAGSLTFATEQSHGYPDIIVRVERIEDAKFDGRSVSFTAKGMYHDDPVTVEAAAWDGQGTGEPDRFRIECTNSDGGVVYYGDGEMFIGDLAVSSR